MKEPLESLPKPPCSTDTVQLLCRQWVESGLGSGDMVLVHSSLTATVRRFRSKGVLIKPADVVESFLAAVGERGTLLLPLFNFTSFPEGQTFDIRTTPSEMGVLTEAGRRHPLAVRTGHPIYSFAAIGHQACQFAGVENFSGYGPDSPFAILRKCDGKIAVLDLPDQNSMTYYHHVEEMEQVPYRYHKKFRGQYTNQTGETQEREFGLFVRDWDRGVVTDVGHMEEHLWQLGLYKGFRPGSGSGLRVVRACDLHATTAEIIRGGKAQGMLYAVKKPTHGNA